MPDSIGETSPASGASDLVCASGGQQKICIPHNYQKYDLPTSKGLAIFREKNIFIKYFRWAGPTYVTIGVDIKDIPKVSDQDFSITLNAYFNVKWRDPRLLVSKENKEGTPVKLEV